MTQWGRFRDWCRWNATHSGVEVWDTVELQHFDGGFLNLVEIYMVMGYVVKRW